MPDIASRPYRPNSEMCCECCVFGTGVHAEWCDSVARLSETDLPLTEAQLDKWAEQWVKP